MMTVRCVEPDLLVRVLRRQVDVGARDDELYVQSEARGDRVEAVRFELRERVAV